MLDACDKSISLPKPPASKVIPGWTDYVQRYFQSSLLWHDIWKANGQPKEGTIADLRRKTRSEYHKVCKMVMRCEGQIKSDKMAEALRDESVGSFWKKVKELRPKKVYYPSKVDDVADDIGITQVFAQKFNDLYNSVSYDNDDMASLKNDINRAVDEKCLCNCPQGNHCIIYQECLEAIRKLKNSKSDGCTGILSDHIIHAGDKLACYLALLFTAMLRHGSSPDGIVLGTMIPLPKGRWNDLSCSDNFRAITLSSIFGKLLDFIILVKEEKHLCTSDLQFSFKKGASTTLCTSMMQETTSYYVHNGTNVYGLLLDASKAFDRVNYCKLFRILLDRGFCPMYSRLMLNMYTSQKLRVRWKGEVSELFSASNGVKQGGVISPILFCVYMDGLLHELASSGLGCHMGGVFAGAYAYADDLTILCPSVIALHEMSQICEEYAKKYDVTFNAKKSQVIVFKAQNAIPSDPCVKINGTAVPRVDRVIHLGHLLTENVYEFNVSKCIDDFNRQCNIFFADFKNCSSHIRNVLFQRYCTSFYGSQLLPHFDGNLNGLYTAWRVAIRRVWRLPWRTHSNMLPHIAGVMDPKLWFAKRCMKFINMACTSKNVTVNTIGNMGKYSSYSIMGANYKMLKEKYDMNESNVFKSWDNVCNSNEDTVRKCAQVVEVAQMRDSCTGGRGFTRGEYYDIINVLCTE